MDSAQEAPYVFIFGYETPALREGYEKHGWDGEVQQMVVIVAASREEAEAWGVQIAEKAVAWLFEKAKWREPVSWIDDQFAYWTETELEDLSDVPLVRVGKFPPFEGWIN